MTTAPIMSTFDMGAVLLLLAVVIGIVNERTLRLPRPVALLLGALAMLVVIIAADAILGETMRERIRDRLTQARLSHLLLDGVVALLLFAGSLQVDLNDLRRRAIVVFLLSTLSVFLASILFGVGLWAVLWLLNEPIPPSWCLVAGAVLAPTDAVAVEGLLARVRLPAGLRATIAGESLFNDGAAVVLFGTALALANGHHEMVGHGRVVEAIVFEGLGGALLGAAAGYLGYRIIRLTEDSNLATTVSLALALSTYRAAVALGVSAPIAVVFAGMVLGSALGREPGGGKHHAGVFTFWPFVDETLNTLLYLLIGFEVLRIDWSWDALLTMAIAVPLALFARLLSVGAPMLVLRLPHPIRTAGIITWAGLRGGISIALAIIIPQTPYRNMLLTISFGVVIFTVVVQGLLLPRVITVLSSPLEPEPQPEPSTA
jgi:monovalent cation:H+ antiporter, CPA1 family